MEGGQLLSICRSEESAPIIYLFCRLAVVIMKVISPPGVYLGYRKIEDSRAKKGVQSALALLPQTNTLIPSIRDLVVWSSSFFEKIGIIVGGLVTPSRPKGDKGGTTSVPTTIVHEEHG